MIKPDQNAKKPDLEPIVKAGPIDIYMEGPYSEHLNLYDIGKSSQSLSYKGKDLGPDIPLIFTAESRPYAWLKKSKVTYGPCPSVYWNLKIEQLKDGVADILKKFNTDGQMQYSSGIHVVGQEKVDPIKEIFKLVDGLYQGLEYHPRNETRPRGLKN